jgi:hypothetical protein
MTTTFLPILFSLFVAKEHLENSLSSGKGDFSRRPELVIVSDRFHYPVTRIPDQHPVTAAFGSPASLTRQFADNDLTTIPHVSHPLIQ